MDHEAEFKLASSRSTVEINLEDGRVLSGPRGAPVGDFLRAIAMPEDVPIVGAVVNGSLRELTLPITMDAQVRPVTMSDEDGMLIYRRSLTFLQDVAFEEMFPEAVLTIDHSVASGGYYCQVSGHAPLTTQELAALEKRMRELAEADLPFTKRETPLAEAIAYFKAKGYTDKVRLLTHRKKPYLTLYRLNDHQDYHHGYMVPSTGYLRWFSLIATNGGFTLHFPRRHSPTQLTPMPEYPKLLAAFRQYGDWLNLLGVSSVGALNDAITSGRAREIILVSEALHEMHVAEISAMIAERSSQVRVVLIAGPSSSGKTTFSKRLSVQLLAHGLAPVPIEMDNFFLDRDKTPRNSAGEFDFESINALDRQRLTHDLSALIAGEQARLPHFNFKAGLQEDGETIQLEPNQIMILEGIHGLDPQLLPGFSPETTFRIYVSALTQLNLDRQNRISTTDTREVRRIVRDARERGYSARDTIQRWESVVSGEKVNIFPYQENADVMFNSALAYELAALKPLAEPLLRQVPYGTQEHIEAKRMLALLEWFLPLESALIPDNSLLREFIGGSSLEAFKLWQNLG
jgi:uridine kinase